jgi:hypothetical protein
MEKMKIIVKIDKDGDFIAFFPESSANIGGIECWQIIGQHGEASYDYYRDCRKPRKDKTEEVEKFMRIYLNDYNGINGDFFELKRVYKISYKQCQKIWNHAK